MRLLYCSRDYTTHDLRFVRALVGAGIEVHYLRLESDGVPYVDDPLPAGAQWVEWCGGGAPLPAPEAVARYFPAFASVVGALRPDLIHAGPVQTFGLMAALLRSCPSVLVSWGSDLLVEADRDAWYLWASATAVRHTDAFLCDSPPVLERARQLGDGALTRHLCIPWGPDLLPRDRNPGRRQISRQQRGWEDAIVVASSRAWHPGYMVPDLIDAFAEAALRQPRLQLALSGSGSERPEVEARIARHGLEARVYRSGVLPATELALLLEASDIYLALVPSDGSSIALLEAMGHGLPAIVRRNPGNSWWVEDGVTGFLVEPANGEGWSEKLLALAQDSDRREAVGRAAQTLVRHRADWSRNAPLLIDFYRRTAHESRASNVTA